MMAGMKRRTILLLGAFLVATLAIGCDDSETPPDIPSPTSDASAASYDAFAADLAAALEREDAEWFAEHAASFGVAVFEGGSAAFGAGPDALGDLMEDAFATADAGAQDGFGSGEWRLYAVGEEAFPSEDVVSIFLATAIVTGPEAGRRALAFKAIPSPDAPAGWILSALLQAPPPGAEEVLALGPLPAPSADPGSYPEGFAAFADAVERAVQEADAATLASMLKTEPYTCPETPPAILSVPACGDEAAGEEVNAVPWAAYCLACDAGGMATPAEIEAWLSRFFATSGGAASDELGPAAVALESVSHAVISSAFDISITGVGDPGIVDLPRSPGRWIVTFRAEEDAEGWGLTGMLLGDPDNSGWVVESMRGTNIVWTRWPGIE